MIHFFGSHGTIRRRLHPTTHKTTSHKNRLPTCEKSESQTRNLAKGSATQWEILFFKIYEWIEGILFLLLVLRRFFFRAGWEHSLLLFSVCFSLLFVSCLFKYDDDCFFCGWNPKKKRKAMKNLRWFSSLFGVLRVQIRDAHTNRWYGRRSKRHMDGWWAVSSGLLDWNRN